MPAAIPIATLALAAGSTAYSMSQANKAKKEEQKRLDEIKNYNRQELTNAYNNISVSTMGADRQREDLARIMATYANQAALGGTSSILGLAPNMVAQQNAQEAQIAAALDQQWNQNQQLIAGGDMAIQQAMEQRENNDLLGLGNMANNAAQARQQSINSAIQGGIATIQAGANMYGSFANNRTPSATTNNAGNSNVGITPKQSSIFASAPTNPVGDALRGNLPQGIQSFQAPIINPVVGKTGNYAPNLLNLGLYGQQLYYYPGYMIPRTSYNL